MGVDALAGRLQDLATTAFQNLAAANAKQDWDEAIAAQLEWLFWRASALSAELGVDLAPLRGAQSSIVRRLTWLINSCQTKLASTGNDAASRAEGRKIENVIDMLAAIQAVLKAFKSLGDGTGNAPAMLAMAGAETGRADVFMTMAEVGHWEEIAKLGAEIKRRHGGRTIGYLADWKEKAAPVIQKWINAEPMMKREALIAEVVAYLDREGTPKKEDTVRNALQKMRKRGLITFPP